MTSRYSGYVPYTAKESLLTWPPGQESRATAERKYYTEKAPVAPDATFLGATVYGSTTCSVGKDDYHAPRRSNEIAVLPVEKPLVKRSLAAACFSNFNEEHIPLRDLTEEDAAAAFATVDTKGEGFITATEVRMALRASLGGAEPTPRQLKVVEAMVAPALKANRGRVAFAAWYSGLQSAARYLEEEVLALRPEYVKRSVVIPAVHHEAREATRRMGVTASSLGIVAADAPAGATATAPGGFEATSSSPSLALSSSSSSSLLASTGGHGGTTAAAATGGAASGSGGLVLHGPQPKTSYSSDMGGHDDVGPAARPVHDPLTRGLFATTRDLASGTTRQSKHVPGFGGHIPTLVGGHAPLHGRGLGTTARDTFDAKTNLSDTLNTRVPGYGGHIPRFTTGARSTATDVRIPSGQFAPTEHATAAHVISTYWDTRKAVAMGALAASGTGAGAAAPAAGRP